MATQTDRQAAGRKAAATRHQNDALKAAKRARKDAGNAFANVGSAARSMRDATLLAGKSVARRVPIGSRD
jgi:hypothetical protein